MDLQFSSALDAQEFSDDSYTPSSLFLDLIVLNSQLNHAYAPLTSKDAQHKTKTKHTHPGK